MIRFLRMLLALAAVPFAWALVVVFLKVVCLIPTAPDVLVPREAWAFLAGIVTQLLAYMFLPKPVRVYVLGHELTHAVWALLFGARVGNLRVGVRGGSVSVSKSNVWITLAPYFFPFYTVLVVLAAAVVRLCVQGPVPCSAAWLFAVGLTWCFHVCFTLHSLGHFQSDVAEYGRIFSWTFIWIFNFVGMLLGVVCATAVSWRTAGAVLLAQTSVAYGSLYAAACTGFAVVRSWL